MPTLSVALPNSIRLSEFLPHPKANGEHEWVELANDADMPADLSGWSIDDADGGGSPYRLPQGSIVSPYGLLLVELPKALFNNAGDSIRLLRPDGAIADQYSYTQGDAGLSFCQIEGAWNACAPTPNAPNRAATQALPTATLASPEIQTASYVDGGMPEAAVTQPATAPPMLAATQSGAITSVAAYANATAGALYRGFASPMPMPSPDPRPTVPPAARPVIALPAQAPAVPSLGMSAGMFLVVAGGALASYERLRARRAPADREPIAPEEAYDQIDETHEEIDD